MIVLLASMLALGAFHGLGPDHCLAISALAAQRRRAAMSLLALRFGAAHAAVLFLFAGLVWAFGWTLPPGLERAGEIANGTLLIVLGAGLVFEKLGRGLKLHTHVHRHAGHSHVHVHAHRVERAGLRAPATAPRGVAVRFVPADAAHGERAHQHRHSSSAWVVGGLFALSGIRNTAMALPIALQGRAGAAALALLCFGLGVVASMVAYGFVVSAASSAARSRIPERAVRIGLGLAAAAFGCYWIAAS